MKYLPGGVLRRKSLEIIYCTQCHYLVWKRVPVAYCTKMGDNPRPSYIQAVGEIPSWCPLEDWPDE